MAEEKLIRKLTEREIEALSTIDLATFADARKGRMIRLILAYILVVGASFALIYSNKMFFINELRLMQNVDVEFAVGMLDQRMLKVGILSLAVLVAALINRYFTLTAAIVLMSGIFGMIDDFTMRFAHSHDPLSPTLNLTTALRLTGLILLFMMVRESVTRQD